MDVFGSQFLGGHLSFAVDERGGGHVDIECRAGV